jgi:hypothetical protein
MKLLNVMAARQRCITTMATSTSMIVITTTIIMGKSRDQPHRPLNLSCAKATPGSMLVIIQRIE